MKQIASLCLIVVLGSVSCRSKGHSPFQANTTVSSAPAIVAPKVPAEQFAVPVGPPLPVLAGRGMGPLRFGASLATVERILGAPCTKREKLPDPAVDKERCLYAFHGVEFETSGGKITRMRVHGDERPFPGGGGTPDGTWGVFKGSIGGAGLGMYANAVVEVLGEPLSIEKLDPPQGATVVRHTYANKMVLEYDKLENGNVVLAGINLDPDADAIDAARQQALAAVSAAAAPGSAPSVASAAPSADSASEKPVKGKKPKKASAKPRAKAKP